MKSSHSHAGTYTCPMHPEVHRSAPGICPECGMKLVPTGDRREGYEKHAGHSTQMFLRKFVVSLVLTFPIVLYSELPKSLGWAPPAFPGSEYLMLAFGSVVFFYGGWVFVAGAARELAARLPGMMTLIALAVTAAFAWSVYATFAGASPLFWELSTLITIMLLGHWFEMRAVKGASGALRELAKLLPDKAVVIRNGKSVDVGVSELRVGDTVLVKPGGKLPADGRVVDGQSEVDESVATGESRPVAKKAGDEVIAGTANGDGSLKIEVTKIGEGTFLAGVMRLVADAQASKSRLQILSDKAAFLLTIIAVVAGGVTLSAWLLAGAGLSFAVTRLVTVLVIACPHALGLAVPLVASISTSMAANNGFLVRHRLALEAARKVDVVLFDKTGTLTKGEFGVDAVIPAPGFTESDVLKFGASVNQNSEHSIARALVREARGKAPLSDVRNFQRMAGKGARGELDGKDVLVGSEGLLKDFGVARDAVSREAARLEGEGKTVVYVAVGQRLAGAISLIDAVREESREAVAALRSMGVRVSMITGDSGDVAAWAAKELGIEEYFARVLPDEKAGKVRALQENGLRVAMVGDGINDAPALTQADVGIAVGAGTNVAIESAGIILVRNDPRDIPKIIRLSRRTYSKMLQNLFWATGYNVVAIPLAAGALVSEGILLEPAVGAVLMSVSTVIVALNALMLRRSGLL